MALQAMCMMIIGIIFGLVVCFGGYRFFLILLPIWGFFAGFALGAGAITALLGDGFLATTTSWVVGFVSALIFAVLSYLFYAIGVAIFAGSFGYAIGAGLLALFSITSPWIVIPVGLIGAVIAIWITFKYNLQKYVIITITALGGAAALVGAVLIMFGSLTVQDVGTRAVQAAIAASPFWIVVWLVVGAFGAFIQLRTTPRFVMKEPGAMERAF